VFHDVDIYEQGEKSKANRPSMFISGPAAPNSGHEDGGVPVGLHGVVSAAFAPHLRTGAKTGH
jgi:hypothetical protein